MKYSDDRGPSNPVASRAEMAIAASLDAVKISDVMLVSDVSKYWLKTIEPG
jgi:hypothetical protein